MGLVRVRVDLWIDYEVLKNNSYDAGFDMSGDAKEDCEGLVAQAVDSLLALERMEISSTVARQRRAKAAPPPCPSLANALSSLLNYRET